MKKSNIGAREITLYVIFSLLALAGITLVALGIIGQNLTNIDNALRSADKTFADTMKMSFTVFGSLVVMVAAILAAITLSVNGQKAELIAEKKARRAQRLQIEEGNDVE